MPLYQSILCPGSLLNILWQPYALAFALLSMFSIFIVEIFAFRWGTARLTKLGIHHGLPLLLLLNNHNSSHSDMTDAHGHQVGSMNAHGPEGYDQKQVSPDASHAKDAGDAESQEHQKDLNDEAAGRIIGIAILEFGVILHRYSEVCRMHSGG